MCFPYSTPLGSNEMNTDDCENVGNEQQSPVDRFAFFLIISAFLKMLITSCGPGALVLFYSLPYLL